MDFVPLEAELFFSSDALIQCVNITILPDDRVEEDEAVTISLNSSDAAVVIVQASSSITIEDSDQCKFCKETDVCV